MSRKVGKKKLSVICVEVMVYGTRGNEGTERSGVHGRNPCPGPTPSRRRLRRLDRCAFGASHFALSALGFMRPVFSVSIVGNPNCD